MKSTTPSHSPLPTPPPPPRPGFPFTLPVGDGSVNTESTHKPCYTLVYFSGTIDLFHFVNLSLPVISRMSKKKKLFFTRKPFFHFSSSATNVKGFQRIWSSSWMCAWRFLSRASSAPSTSTWVGRCWSGSTPGSNCWSRGAPQPDARASPEMGCCWCCWNV